MIDAKQVGNHIVSLRKSMNFTQLELADKVNITHQAVSKWERGESLPDIDSLYQLSLIFDISIDEIIKGSSSFSSSEKDHNVLSITHENVQSLWTQALAKISKTISTPSFNTWFKNTSAHYRDHTLYIITPNLFSRDWLNHRYAPMIRKVLSDLVGEDSIQIVFESDGKYTTYNTI